MFMLFVSQKLQKDMETFTVDNQKLMQEHKWVRWFEFVVSLSKGKTDREFKRWKYQSWMTLSGLKIFTYKGKKISPSTFYTLVGGINSETTQSVGQADSQPGWF